MYWAALLFQASVAAPAFAPPTDVAIRITTERTDSGIAERQVRLERIVRFFAQPGGYRAEVRLIRAPDTAPDALAQMMESGFGALVGSSITLHLDHAGKVTGIDGLTLLWERFCTGIGGVAAARKSLKPGEREALARQVAAPLLALPPERQQALLGSLVTAAIAEPASAGGATEPVRVPAHSAFGAAMMLDGMRHSTLLATGEREVTVRAAAALPDGGRLELETLVRSDLRTGLIVLDRETTRTRTAAGEAVKTTTIRLAREPIGGDH